MKGEEAGHFHRVANALVLLRPTAPVLDELAELDLNVDPSRDDDDADDDDAGGYLFLIPVPEGMANSCAALVDITAAPLPEVPPTFDVSVVLRTPLPGTLLVVSCADDGVPVAGGLESKSVLVAMRGSNDCAPVVCIIVVGFEECSNTEAFDVDEAARRLVAGILALEPMLELNPKVVAALALDISVENIEFADQVASKSKDDELME
ncbi:hypothetical protein BGZ70_009248 [Mortierella alpina]|uniref:Uncharacterized protein n=1 Tax=Mortierella alpina TaxID=64518 RepID=A0A9P6J287_MORAP|nr:hypothetical protein BGZ70_009248 [Mortierella alpina]